MLSRNLNQLEWNAGGELERLLSRGVVLRYGVRTLGTLRLWYKRYRDRRQLRALRGRDERFFKDIGVSSATVYAEGSKWFWQA